MLDEFDVPNVEDAVTSYADNATTESWSRIKAELMESQATVIQQLKTEIAAFESSLSGGNDSDLPRNIANFLDRIKKL
jgi:hypothetical protein